MVSKRIDKMHLGVFAPLYVMYTNQVNFHLRHSGIDYFVQGKHTLLCSFSWN